jgi:hypothetical protein
MEIRLLKVTEEAGEAAGSSALASADVSAAPLPAHRSVLTSVTTLQLPELLGISTRRGRAKAWRLSEPLPW